MESGEQTIRPMAEIAGAFRSLPRGPFVTLLLLDFLVAAVAASIGDQLGPNASDDHLFLVLTSSIFFAGATIYLQIAVTLAAASGGQPHAADAWVKGALRQRCFWRFVGASLLAAFLILLGAFGFVMGAIVLTDTDLGAPLLTALLSLLGVLGLVVGAIVGSAVILAQPAVVLERKLPLDALRRSVELSKQARLPLAIILVLLWLPPLVLAVIFDIIEVELSLVSQVLMGLGSSTLAVAATIALTRTFVKLGGAPSPPLQTLLYKAKAGSRG